MSLNIPTQIRRLLSAGTKQIAPGFRRLLSRKATESCWTTPDLNVLRVRARLAGLNIEKVWGRDSMYWVRVRGGILLLSYYHGPTLEDAYVSALAAHGA